MPPSPLPARYEADGVWVADRFVVFGGWSSSVCPPNASCIAPVEPALRDGASFDPRTGQWTRIADAPVPITGLNTVVLDGRLYTLVNAGLGRPDSPVTFLSYDPARNAWTKHPLPPGAGALVATDSALVQIGDSDEREPAVDAAFDPKTNAWQRLPDDPLGPSFARSAVWVDHSLVLAAGDLVDNPGSKAPVLVRIARLDENLKRWTKLPAGQILGNALVGVADRAVWADDGSADGGGDWDRAYPNGGTFDPGTNTWHALPWPAQETQAACCSGVVVGGTVIVGKRLLDPVTGRWSAFPEYPGPRRTAATLVGGPQSLLVWGGAVAKRPEWSAQENVASGYLWRPAG